MSNKKSLALIIIWGIFIFLGCFLATICLFASLGVLNAAGNSENIGEALGNMIVIIVLLPLFIVILIASIPLEICGLCFSLKVAIRTVCKPYKFLGFIWAIVAGITIVGVIVDLILMFTGVIGASKDTTSEVSSLLNIYNI